MRPALIALAALLYSCNAPAPELAATAEGTVLVLPEASPSWESARAAGVDFRGVGQEPGWLLDIYTNDRIVLEWDYGDQRAVFPLPAADTEVEGETRYEAEAEGHVVQITIRPIPCQDTMSGEAFPSTVEVEISDVSLSGCGRSV